MRRPLAIVLVTIFVALLPWVASSGPVVWEYRGAVSASEMPQLIPVGAPARFVFTLTGTQRVSLDSCYNCTLPYDYYGWYSFDMQMMLGDIGFTGRALLEINFNAETGQQSQNIWRFTGYSPINPSDNLWAYCDVLRCNHNAGGSGPAFPLGEFTPPGLFSDTYNFIPIDLSPTAPAGHVSAGLESQDVVEIR
jgi:hypothetical protein